MRTLPLLLLALFALTCTPKSLKLHNARNLAGYYAQPGTFELVSGQEGIVQQQPGVYVNVLFDKQKNGSGSLDFTTNGGTMMMSLYSSKTMLALDCLKFEAFNCTLHKCEEYKEQIDSFEYTNFTAEGYKGKATIFIDTNYWSLNHSVFLADECESYKKDKNGFGHNIDGIIGMGVEGEALTNFPTHQTYDSIMGGSETVATGKPAIFSFFLNDDGRYGELIFQADMDKVKTSTPTVTLSSDANWHVSGVTQVQVGDTVFNLPTNLIFDINADALGLPLDTYKRVVQQIQDSAKDLTCETEKNIRPVCQYKGKLEDLPTLHINVQDQVISIYPEIYAEVVKEMDLPTEKIVLNIRGLSTSATDGSYVTEKYSNYVILSQRAMAYYYTVFDTNRKVPTDPLTIKMYLANHGNSSKALITVVVCTVIGLIVGLSIYRYKKIQKARMAASTSPLLQTEMSPLQQSRSYR